MKRDYERRVAEYKVSNMNRRLDMYMQYPVLRTRFLEIDRSELETMPMNTFHQSNFQNQEPAAVVPGFGGRLIHFVAVSLGIKQPGIKCRDLC